MTRPVMTMLLAVLLVGCAGGGPAPVDYHFRLIVPTPAALPAPALDGVLIIKRFAADGLLAQRPLVYARAGTPQALYQYNYHFWTDAPTVMLQEFSVRYLRRARVATQVLTPVHGVSADFVLVGRIERLEHLKGEVPAVAVDLELGVFDERRRELVRLGSYREEIPVTDAGVGPAVAVMNEAVSRILARFVADSNGR